MFEQFERLIGQLEFYLDRDLWMGIRLILLEIHIVVLGC